MNKNKKKKVIIGIIAILILALCCIPPKSNNAKYKLNIISTYGDDEAYHPKVLSFKNAWNGYKYWMSYTPYPQEETSNGEGNDLKENPHIAVSNDLINWTTLTNLDEPSDPQLKLRYNSDAHIVYNNDLNRLECYWRYVDDIDDKAVIYRRYTADGINWSEKEIAFIKSPRSKEDCVSPAILFEDGKYKMWYVDKNGTVKYTTSLDGKEWETPRILKLNYEESVKTWHLDVISTEKGYEMLVVAYESWKLHNDMSLYYSYSKNGIEWSTAKAIIRPNVKTQNWDNRGIYRSSMIYEDGIYYLYYSGTNKKSHHGTGFVFGKDIYNLEENKTNYNKKKDVDKLKIRIKEYSI